MTYARITLQSDRSTLFDPHFPAKPFYLRITKETASMLLGVEVDVEGEAVVKTVKGQRVDETQHIIGKDVIVKRVPYVMDNTYAMLRKWTS